MKKTLSLILALLMSVSCASFAFADNAEEEVLLDDAAIAEEAEEEAVEVEEPTIYQEAIDFLNAYGIYKGYGADKMGANDDIQRYQMALFTSRIATGWVDDAAWNTGIWDTAYTAFTDVNKAPAANYLGAISYANQNGIIEGYGDGRFGPTDGITYQNALTMVVRALGYQNLNWPWGYIEKAVNLGLTKGIVDVAYTDVLTRGEVAQVIYNALFATTKDGTTLGAKNFGIEFGWETIIITASDGAWFTGADAKAAAEKKDGIVAYKIVESDGTLSDDTYYTAASTFKFEGHQDELAVGKLFKVSFNKDGILFAKSLYVDTLWNFGPETTEVKDYFAGKTAVSKYTETTYLTKNGQIAYKDEVIVAEGTYGTTYKWTEVNHNLLAIDWDNGNILSAITDKDGKITGYQVEWYYNALLDQYYNIKTKATGKDPMDGEIEIVGIDLLDEKDVEDLLKKLNVEKTADVLAYNILTANPAYSAYASLELFDLNGHDYGVYTSYRLGKIAEETNDHCGHGKKQHVIITDLSNEIAGKTYAAISGKDYVPMSIDMPLAGQCRSDDHKDCRNKEAWWTADYAPELDEDGKIETNYVIYNYNKATNELRVVETLEAKTGVLRAYSVGKQTINIDGTTYSFKYDAFEGDLFAKTDDMNKNYVTKAITAAYLKGLFNQFVEFVVVDDAIVYVNAKGATTNNYLVVESYAGVSNDGYIVVNAYSTADLKLKQYRIGSYNGWEKGDYFYYLNDATAKESFSKGVIYNVSSYDKANDVYYVELVGSFEKENWNCDGFNFFDRYYVDGIKTKALSKFKVDEDGYISFTLTDDKGKTEDVDFKSSSKDTWIIIGCHGTEDYNYVPMTVFTGKIPTDSDWTVFGDYVKLADNLYLVVNAFGVKGFDYDEFAASYVVFLGNKKNSTLTATYDVYGNEDADWYLLGASTYEVNVFDLMKGEEKVVSAQNVKLRAGYIYITLDGKIVDDDKYTFTSSWNVAQWQYRDKDYDTADFFFYGKDKFQTAWLKDGKYNGEKFNEWLVTAKVTNDEGVEVKRFDTENKNYHKGLKTDGKLFVLEVENDLVINYKNVTDEKFFEKNADKDYDCYFVYDVKNNTVVIYLVLAATTKTTEGKTVATDPDFEVNHDSFIEATLTYDEAVTTPVDGKATKAIALDEITFDYIGACEKDVHGVVASNNNYFMVDSHFENFTDAKVTIYTLGEKTTQKWVNGSGWNWSYWGWWYDYGHMEDVTETVVTAADPYEYHGSVVVETYDEHGNIDEICDLVKTIRIDVKDADGKSIVLKNGESVNLKIEYATNNGAYVFNVVVSVDADGEVAINYVNNDAANTQVYYYVLPQLITYAE